MSKIEKNKLLQAVCDKAKTIAKKNQSIELVDVYTMRNQENGEELGWAPCFKVDKKYILTNEALENLAEAFCTEDYNITSGEQGLEIAVNVWYKSARLLISEQEDAPKENAKPKGVCVKISIYGLGDLRHHVEDVVYYQYNLPIWMVEKWKWYFEYLAALVKVNNPNSHVELHIGPQDVLAGQDWINYKRKTLLSSKRGQLKKLESQTVQDDLFGLTQNKINEKIERIKKDITALENDEVIFPLFPEYINKIKKWINN